MGSRAQTSFAVMAIAVIALASVLVFSADDVNAPSSNPQELYPYADAIIYEERGAMSLMYRDYASDGTYEWENQRITGSSFTALRLSEGGGSYTLVMAGGSLSELVLVGADADTLKDADIRFEMYGGSVDTLRLVGLSGDAPSDGSMRPVNSAEIILDSGRVREFMPTDQEVTVGSLEVTVGQGMTVDRMYISGEVGRYGKIAVTVLGGTVGYMSNVRSVIGSISYDIKAGTVYYMCIGADTEAGNASSLSSMSTSYITGDVSVSIGSMVEVRQVVIGGGVFSAPDMLYDGSIPIQPAAKTVVIDSPAVEVRADTCFLNNNRSFAYHFDSYRAGSTPSTTQIHSTVDFNGSSLQIYGEGCLWEGYSAVRVLSGTTFYTSAQLQVASDGVLYIDGNGSMVNSGLISLEGNIVNRGSLVNNYIIEKFRNGEVVGAVTGSGYVAKSISITSAQEVISVMSADDSVMIHLDDNSVDISQISAVLGSGSVDIALSEGSRLSAESFLISLTDVSADGNLSYRLSVLIDGEFGDINGSTVTLGIQQLGDFRGEVWCYDTESGEYQTVPVDSGTSGSVTFVPVGCGSIYINEIGAGAVEDSSGDDQTFQIALLSILIVLTVAATFYMYAQLRRR